MLRTFLKEVLDFINKAVRPLVVFTILLFFFLNQSLHFKHDPKCGKLSVFTVGRIERISVRKLQRDSA